MEGIDINTSFSICLEKILLSDSCFDEYMANIEQISTMDAEKYRGILSKVNPSVLIDLRKRIVDLLQSKFDLDTYKIKETNGNTNSLIKDIWYCTICFVENKINPHVDNIFESPSIPASQFVESELMNNDNSDMSTLIKAFLSMKQEVENMKVEIKDLKIEKEKMRIEINALKSNNEDLTKKVNDLISIPPKTPLTGYSSALNFQFPTLSQVVRSQQDPMEVDTIRNKRGREQIQSQPQAKKPMIPVNVIKPTENDKRKVTKTIGNKVEEGFLVVEKKRYFPVYMGRVSKDMKNDEVKKYLHDKDIGAYDIEQLNTEKHDRFKSFKFKIPHDKKDIIYDCSLWPKGLLLRKFLAPRNGPSNEGVRLVDLPVADSNTANTN